MIFDNINNLNNYSEMKDIYNTLKFLKTVTGGSYPKERADIESGRIFANPVTLVSKPVEDCIFEAHRKYIDIHYIVEGLEGISTGNTCELTAAGSFDEEKDIGFYSGEPSGTYYLRPGDFMVCWPQDAHRVAMMGEKPGEIRKIVAKIKIQEG